MPASIRRVMLTGAAIAFIAGVAWVLYAVDIDRPPVRVIRDPYNCGLYVDQKTGDIYSVNNDTIDTITVFSRNAQIGRAHV